MTQQIERHGVFKMGGTWCNLILDYTKMSVKNGKIKRHLNTAHYLTKHSFSMEKSK
jgi:hypothetical protein